MLKTKIKIGIFSLFFLTSRLGTPFLHASSNSEKQCGPNASVCLQTPTILTTYLEFQQKAIALMASDPFQTTTEQVELGEGGIFTNKLLKLKSTDQTTNLPVLTDLAKELETAVTNLVAGATTTSALFLLSALSTLNDSAINFLILFQERPIVRDRSKLLDIDRRITETAYLLGQNGKITKKIKDTALLNKIVAEYQENGLLKKGASFPAQISYIELLSELQSLNIQMKNFLALNNTYSLSHPDSSIQISETQINLLKDEYRCTRFTLGFRCNPAGYSFLANLKTLLSNTEKTGKSATNTIQQSLNKLSQALKGFKNFRSSKNESLTSEELELLRQVYGLDTTKLTQEQLSSISPAALSQSTKALFKNIKSDILEQPSYLKETTDFKKNSLQNNLQEQAQKKLTKEERIAQKKAAEEANQKKIEEAKKKLEEEERLRKEHEKQVEERQLETAKLKSKYTNPKLSELLHTGLQMLFEANQQINHEIEVGNTILISNQFAHLSFQIQQIATTIGNKQSGTRQLLDQICRYQCSNHQSATCYIQ